MDLDALDWLLLRELYQWGEGNYPRGPLRISHEALARRVSHHPNTVRLRLQAMRRAGVLDGSFLEVHPDLLGVVRAGHLLETSRFLPPAALEDALRPFPWVSLVAVAAESLFVHSWHEREGDVARDLEALASALRATRVRRGYLSTNFRAPPPSVTPTDLDWRLVLALRKEPSASLAAVARRLGVTERTAERRAQRLVRSGGAAMVPRMRPERVTGSVLVHYVAWDGDAGAPAQLARAFPERVLGPFPGDQVSTVLVPLPNLAEVERRRAEAESLPGVGRLHAFLLAAAAYPRAFDEWLARRVGTLQASARSR